MALSWLHGMLDNAETAESQEKGYGRDGAERYRMGVHRYFYLDCDSGKLCVKTYKQVHFKCVDAKYSTI